MLPAKDILVVIALVCAVLFFANAFRQGWTLPLVGTGLLVVSALVIGGLYPALVQQFQVKPSELVREQEYIKRNIEATRAAYGLDEAEFSDYAGTGEPTADTLKEDAGTLTNIRLLDPAVVAPTFRQLQQIRSFYAFPDALDVDRYPLDSGLRGAIIAVREVNLDGVGERNWANDHAVFTHGYGVVAAYDNTAGTDGRPSFIASDVPVTGELEIEQPRIYFGEESPDYSIVGAPEGAEPRELDFPDDTSPTGQRNNTYTGQRGRRRGGPLPQAAVRRAVPGPEHRPVLAGQLRVQDPVRPGAGDPRGQGGALADHRRRPVPRGRRRPGEVDRRRATRRRARTRTPHARRCRMRPRTR